LGDEYETRKTKLALFFEVDKRKPIDGYLCIENNEIKII
jgi:hypothetical protein